MRWAFPTGERVVSSPLAYGQVIYFGSYDDSLYAVRIYDGSRKWAFPTGGIIKSSPLAYNGVVYFGSADKFLYALDTANGAIRWQQNINGAIDCSPMVDDLSGKSYNSSISGLSIY